MSNNQTMTSRQRYVETLTFGEVDKVPLKPGAPRESTLEAWHRQGLPQGVDWYPYLMDQLDIDYEPSPDQPTLGVSFKMIPQFEEEVLEHTSEGTYIVRDWMGAITEISDKYDYTYIREAKDFVTRRWHKFPVEDRGDWKEKMKPRYDPQDPQRFPEDLEERCSKLQEARSPVTFKFNGPFWQLREWVGFENLCKMMIREEDFVQEMIDFWM